MDKIWFTSDIHFNHKNIIQYDSRPWSSIKDMNAGIISNWNSLVSPQDAVYFLGDFTLTSRTELVDEWLGQLNGTIRVIRGNHDVGWLKKFDKLKNSHKIKWIKDYAERTFTINNRKINIVMCHYPMMSWNGSNAGSIMCHGHCHGSIQDKNKLVRRVDVGTNCNNYHPLSLHDIVEMTENKSEINHHGKT